GRDFRGPDRGRRSRRDGEKQPGAQRWRRPRTTRGRGLAMLERAGERLRVEFDAVRANVRGPSNGRLLRVDKDADTDTVTLETAHDGGHLLSWRVRRPSRLTRDLARLHRHQRALRRFHRMDHVQQVRAWVAFDVELDPTIQRLEPRRYLLHVYGRDVPSISTRMDCDAGRSRLDAHAYRIEHGRHDTAA